MAHGTPDWGLVGPRRTTYGLDDVGEAVVRLGSPVIWDRRGDVIWMETWQYGLRSATTAFVGAGWSTSLVDRYAENGPFALYMNVGGSPDDYVWVVWFHPVFPTSGWGYEVWFSFLTNVNRITFTLMRCDGTDSHVARVEYNVQDSTLRVQTTAAAWYNVPGTFPLYAALRTPHIMKVVADHADDEYHWVVLDDQEVSLRGVPLYVVGGGGAPHSQADVYMYNQASLVGEMAVDTVIITHNEPIQP